MGWIAAALCCYVTDQLLNGGSDLTSKYDFAFVIPANVDGYEYSRNSDRMWRKNRAHNAGSSCRGVDPNRNFDSNHCGQGSSRDPCSETYCGPSPFSQLILSAYGYTNALPSDYSELKASMDAASDALTGTHGKHYEHGTCSNTIYVASGGSSDWYYDGANVHHAYTYECRPTREVVEDLSCPSPRSSPTQR